MPRYAQLPRSTRAFFKLAIVKESNSSHSAGSIVTFGVCAFRLRVTLFSAVPLNCKRCRRSGRSADAQPVPTRLRRRNRPDAYRDTSFAPSIRSKNSAAFLRARGTGCRAMFEVAHTGFDDALISLCARVEALVAGSLAGVTLCNRARTEIERALFPSLPHSFADGLTHSDLQRHNTASVRAITTATTITCVDLASDEFFDPSWRNHCLHHGVRAMQSRPIYLCRPLPYGTFVLAFRERRPKICWDMALMDLAADGVSSAMQRKLNS